MALIDELKEKLKDVETYIAARHAQIREHGSAVEELERQRWDLDLAIAALTPAPAPVEIEDSLAPEGMPECAWETVTLTEDDPDEFEDFENEDTPAEHISILTGDPAIEPESGLHEEAPALNEAMQDEREQPYRIIANVDDKPVTIDFATFHDATECMEELKLRSTSKAELSVLHEGENGEQEWVCHKAELRTRPALNEAMQDEREQPVQPEPDGYAPVTNPEADALARAHDWYDPKAVADRNRFNPWGGVSNLFGKPKVDA